ncbi:MAG: hypothetical protein IKX94_02760, partial [Muribaculaceae bacterium]|nr:hypothetical protein [Muribaculaceae bacterium]
MKRLFRILCIFLFSAATILAASASDVVVKASLDSAYILMGQTTPMHIEILEGSNDLGFMPQTKNDTLVSAVELAGITKADTTDLGNNRR